MAGVNKVILLGHLGADPEVKYLEGEKVVANLSLATSEAYQDRNGNRVEQTEWHELELWDQQAKIAEKYLKKGSQIYVEGKIKSDKWTDEQGQNRKKMKIRVLSFTMVGGKPEGMPAATAPNSGMTSMPNPSPAPNAPMVSLDEGDDDLPF
ncbi:MAG: single-stranded DNA-binding protein [Bacteroidetes bacterium]|nr:single-stranded DNA-binding protein [Bacteroidota bacterium]MDA1268379.1 single-stranded DNA-binding protein [Bacteroidota bacterium]